MPTYTADSSLFPIQERGFFQYTETHPNNGARGYVPLDVNAMIAARTGQNTINNQNYPYLTVVFRYFMLSDYKNQDTIDQFYLNLISNDLAAVRAAGVKIVLRFSYLNAQSKDSDATPARVLKHIDQLAPVLNAYADIIHTMQVGFIGSWGEWYYTGNFGDQGVLSTQNIVDRNAVVSRLLSSLDPSIKLALRYVGSRQQFFGSNSPNVGGNALRIGLHNDAFTMPYADYGTYTTFSNQSEANNRDYLAQMIGIVGGESAGYNPPVSEFPNASSELQKYHWNYINPNYYAQMLSVWGQSGVDTVTKSLGHRLRLVSATIPANATLGSSVVAQVTLANDGWTFPVRNRPVQLILDNGSGQVATNPFPIDITTIGPGQQVTTSVTFVVPSQVGTYQSYLRLPDPASTIAGRSEYMLRLANTGIWDANTGRHALSSPMVVAAGSGGGGTTPVPSGIKKVSKLTTGGRTRVVKLVT